MNKTYKVELVGGEHRINIVLEEQAKLGWKPIYMTPHVRQSSPLSSPPSIWFYITFEKTVKKGESKR